MRLFTSLALVTSLLAGIASAETRFAQPPAAEPVPAEAAAPPAADMPVAPPDIRVAPPVMNRAAVRASLLANRKLNLARFRAYYRAGIYPSNVYRDGLTNVWRDEDGHFCAAATIIRASGQTELVEKVAEENNFIRLADVEQGPLMDWILTSGLTQAEIALIQKPFTRVGDLSPRPVVKQDLKKRETARLLALYKQVDRKLVRLQKQNLERAVDRLMKRPELAAMLVQQPR